ncbi:hypothetical protein GCM10017786_71080 [Amycolatopsis deserti]|uniref:Uncharacterized protein n=1 Tax=Amycolatopsis deserti TaxID=185696 RepID=A0ABQ3JK24_9PSEU|nr:hypothetical protein [Amycolatopsis deserti]GHF26681.1 hypothetical protein GCM10017786_71080 [Amycolatopsis deserti]
MSEPWPPAEAERQGVSIKELADYLGRADPGFTLRTYTPRMTACRRPDLENRPSRHPGK